MSSVALDAVEQSAIESTNIGMWEYVKDLASNRVLHLFEIPKIGVEIVTKSLGAMGVSVGVLETTFIGLKKLVDAENIIFFFQDVIALPEQIKSLSDKVTSWWNGSATTLVSVANQARKFIGHIGSTIGDYVDSCSALAGLGIDVSKISVIPARVGNIGSATGALSRIADYFSRDCETKGHHLTPNLEKIRKPLEESRDFWCLARDVSIFAISSLALAFGFTTVALPAVISLGLSSTILGTRMVAYYKEIQLKALDASHPQMVAAKKVIKAG